MQKQGRRRVLKSCTAIGRHRRSARAEGASGGRAREGEYPPLVRGVRGITPEKIFKIKMSVEAILNHFETNFAYEIRVVRGVRGISPEKIFKIKMSVEAILMHFETTNFACEIRLLFRHFI